MCYHLPKVNPKASGGKESPYFSILDQLQAKSSHCPSRTDDIEVIHGNTYDRSQLLNLMALRSRTLHSIIASTPSPSGFSALSALIL